MRYYKIHQGAQNAHAITAVENGFVGIHYGMPDLSQLNIDDPKLREKIKDIYFEFHKGVSNASAGPGIGAIYRFRATIQIGDIVINPMGDGTYKVGEIIGDYYYAGDNEIIPHRRNVKWFASFTKDACSETLKNTLGAIATISDVTHQSLEIDALLSGNVMRTEIIQSAVDESEFALEKHLEDFLIENWSNTDLGREYDLLKDENGQMIAQQYSTEVGPIDILAVSKDKSELLIVELKKGRSGDAVVGQILRYITAVKNEVAEPNQKVKGVIITGVDDKKIRYSIEPLNGLVDFMVYKIQFSLEKITKNS